MQQKFHKRLPGCFQKLLTDIDLAAVRHTEGGILKIGSILHIDDRAAAADEKARVFFERLCECLEALACGKRFAGSGADIDDVGEASAFLCEDGAARLTGSTFYVDGGMNIMA